MTDERSDQHSFIECVECERRQQIVGVSSEHSVKMLAIANNWKNVDFDVHPPSGPPFELVGDCPECWRDRNERGENP